jgi:hypothetical protein
MNSISFVRLAPSIWRTDRAHASPWDIDPHTTEEAVTLPPGLSHRDTMLLNGEAFEINAAGPSAMRRTPLGTRMNWGGTTDAVRVFGPA